ncbi:alpha/beta fold hydrolase [Salisaeta longa]|uniref:alpha/beta fold hydrolase n=1 Tax=Salisaeta longa TaxID=503170 RepID=UPI0003FE4163|nr:alpha/beta fold hydrolase [Salisaeta longa]
MSDDRSTLQQMLNAGLATAGLYAGLSVAEGVQQRRLPPPTALAPALDMDGHTLETPSGRAHVYHRPGTGTPLVFLHSFNAAASSYEMRPLVQHVVRTTQRPVYAMDWGGFGRSHRNDVAYTPDLYIDQLHRLLDEMVEAPADLVALSLGGEYAATVTLEAAAQVRRLVLISPTGLSEQRGPSVPGRLAIKAAAYTKLFPLIFYRFASAPRLRRYYEQQIFLDEAAVPDALLRYADATTHIRGAHHAPRRFIDGSLFIDDVRDAVYARLYRPTLVCTPANPVPTVQRFDRLPAVLEAAGRDMTHQPLPGGLLPHWEAPAACFDALDAFLLTT